MVYRYVRVSSTDQNEDRQMLAMKEKNVPQANIYMDKQSGKDFNRTLCFADLSFVAESERGNIKKRQEQGILAAREKSVVFGRPGLALPDDFPKIIKDWE